MAVSLNVLADIEHTGNHQKLSETQRLKNRACFQELKIEGCGDPGEDPAHFRSCLENISPTLTPECKILMTKLYGR